MAYHLFTVDTITGRRQVAVKVSKDMVVGDSRHDAYSVAFSLWGRGARIIGDCRSVRRLNDPFAEVASAKGWGWAI